MKSEKAKDYSTVGVNIRNCRPSVIHIRVTSHDFRFRRCFPFSVCNIDDVDDDDDDDDVLQQRNALQRCPHVPSLVASATFSPTVGKSPPSGSSLGQWSGSGHCCPEWLLHVCADGNGRHPWNEFLYGENNKEEE